MAYVGLQNTCIKYGAQEGSTAKVAAYSVTYVATIFSALAAAVIWSCHCRKVVANTLYYDDSPACINGDHLFSKLAAMSVYQNIQHVNGLIRSMCELDTL